MVRIYRITNTISGKNYVGQTSQQGYKRLNGHRHAAKHGEMHPLYSAIRKYGFDSFEYQELAQFETKDDADVAERLWIILLGAHTSANGYVCTWGGDGRSGPDAQLRRKRQCSGRVASPTGTLSPFFKNEYSTEEVVRMYDSGLSSRQIALSLGCSKGLVLERLHTAGVKLRTTSDYISSNKGKKASSETRLRMSTGRQGSSSPLYLLNLDTHVKEMADLYSQGLSTHAIAKQFNCSYVTVKRRLRDYGVPIRKPGRQISTK